MRINRFLAQAGIGSRRACDELVKRGLVSINGESVTSPGRVVDPERDEVVVGGKSIRPAEERLVLVLNKPAGILSAAEDSFGRKTVIDLARERGYPQRLFPVGRLDLDTTGLIILTNDGDLAYRLAHPRYKIAKTYRVVVTGVVADRTAATLAAGIRTEDLETRPCTVRILERRKSETELEVVLAEGRKRQIKRMFAFVGHAVTSLRRTALGELTAADLAEGAIRPLTAAEEIALRERAGIGKT